MLERGSYEENIKSLQDPSLIPSIQNLLQGQIIYQGYNQHKNRLIVPAEIKEESQGNKRNGTVLFQTGVL